MQNQWCWAVNQEVFVGIFSGKSRNNWFLCRKNSLIFYRNPIYQTYISNEEIFLRHKNQLFRLFTEGLRTKTSWLTANHHWYNLNTGIKIYQKQSFPEKIHCKSIQILVSLTRKETKKTKTQRNQVKIRKILAKTNLRLVQSYPFTQEIDWFLIKIQKFSRHLITY